MTATVPSTSDAGAWGEINEAQLARLLERVGVPRVAGASSLFYRHGLDITPEYAARYAVGVADRNPLFTDRSYAAVSPWGRQLAHPAALCWLEQVNGATDGFPGCHTIWRSCELTWTRPLYVGESLSGETVLQGARIVDSEFSGRSAVQDYATAVKSGDEIVGTYTTSWHRFARGESKSRQKHVDTARPQWTQPDLDAVAAEYRSQNLRRRGSEVLRWDDVVVGTDIPYLIKGPTTLTSKIAFESINFPGGWIVGHELALELQERHPGLSIRNEENVPEPPVAIHWTNERCQRHLGMPAGYEAGFERLHWFVQMLMTWMGDHGSVRRLAVQFRGFHWQGDVIRLYGTVTSKTTDGDSKIVTLDVRSETHRGEVTTLGEATVALP